MSPVWYGIGFIGFVLLIAIIFFIGASLHARHEIYHNPPPAGSVPGKPGPVESH